MEEPKPKKPFKGRFIVILVFLFGFSLLVLYLLDQYLIPKRGGFYFAKSPRLFEKNTPVAEEPDIELVPKSQKEGQTVVFHAEVAEPQKPKFNKIKDMIKVLRASYPEWVISEWGYGIEKAKDMKKISKKVFAREIEDWDRDMLGDYANRIKKGFAEFLKTLDEERRNVEESIGEAAEDMDPNSATSGMPKKEIKKEKKKKPPERIDAYSYKVKRFMPGFGKDGYFEDYGRLDFRQAASGKPDFEVANISGVLKIDDYRDRFLSLGNGGAIVYEVTGGEITDTEGPDFVVYGDSVFSDFVKTAKVEVAETDDQYSYVEFPCDSVTPPFKGCAGVHAVNASKSDPILTGGDAFDLAKIGVKKARYIRITDTGDNMSIPLTDGFDIDSIALLNAYKENP